MLVLSDSLQKQGHEGKKKQYVIWEQFWTEQKNMNV
jgi:hypothetical protein